MTSDYGWNRLNLHCMACHLELYRFLFTTDHVYIWSQGANTETVGHENNIAMEIMKIWSLLCVLVAMILFPPPVLAQMRWFNISNPRALCNDFTQAGFFLENYPRSSKWVIFLESGGLCFSPKSCNKRFFHPSIQSKFIKRNVKSSSTSSSDPYANFNPLEAWRSRSEGMDLSTIISPLMSSIHRYKNDHRLFPRGLVINGKDLFDRDCKSNPSFCHHNHVILPYCSSDLWLGNDTRSMGPENEDDFYDQRYRPDSAELQFVFRGAEIFRSAISDLLLYSYYGLDEATELVLVGSSAGGVGVINHVKWLRDFLSNSDLNINISVIIDSAWFIDFNGDIAREFSGFFHVGTSENDDVLDNVDSSPHSDLGAEGNRTTSSEFYSIISWLDACADVRDGVPCCILAHCLLAEEEYYPADVPLFSITSLYDMFLLSVSLRGLVAVASQEQSLKPGYALEFLRIIAEYGGQMNSSVISTGKVLRSSTFFVTGCFQHIYFATSTLWGEPEGSLFGTGLVEVGNDVGVIR